VSALAGAVACSWAGLSVVMGGFKSDTMCGGGNAMDENQLATAARDRIDLLDALRGFALLGIIVVNVRAWAGWFTFEPAGRAAVAGGAQSVWWYEFLLASLVEGKFYTIFSFLFGLGFALQLSRLQRRGLDGFLIYRRRLLVLLAIGLIHMSLLWEGDILTLYALLGLLLPLFMSWSDRRLFVLAILLLLLPIAGVAFVHAARVDPDLRLFELGEHLFVVLGGDDDNWRTWLLREDFRSYFAWTLAAPPFRIGGFFESWRIPKVMAIMLLGLLAGRRLVAGKLLEDRTLLRRVAVFGLLVGIPANIGYGLIGGLGQEEFSRSLIATTLYAVGVVPLGLAYAACFALLWPTSQRILGLLAAPGRMALTNYLSQTILGIAIFYGIGFGLYRSLGPWAFTGVAVAIFAVQIIWSRLWLRYFNQGPMEWLWRQLTYGRSSRREAFSAAA